MKTHIPAVYAVLALLGGSLSVRADVDRTKKEDEEADKARPELDVGHEGESHRKFHERLAREGEENLKEIQRLLDQVNDNLSKQDTGAGTQTKQRQAVEKMRRLIKELSKGCQQCRSGGQGQSQNPQQSQQQQQGGKQQQGGEKREGQKQVASEKQKQQQNEQGRREDNRRNLPNNRVAEDRPPESGKARPRETDSRTDRWGFLPPKLREEMFSAADRSPPSEYGQIVERYYKRISDYYERGRRGSE